MVIGGWQDYSHFIPCTFISILFSFLQWVYITFATRKRLKINIYIHNRELVTMDNGRSKIEKRTVWEVLSVWRRKLSENIWEQYVLLLMSTPDIQDTGKQSQFVWEVTMSFQVMQEFGEIGSKWITVKRASYMFHGPHHLPHHLSLYSNHMELPCCSWTLPDIRFCLRTFAPVLCFLCFKSLPLLSLPSSLWPDGTFLLRSVILCHSAPIECVLHKDRRSLVCFIHHCIPSVYKSIWDIVGDQ